MKGLLLACLFCACTARAGITDRLPAKELKILSKVGREYGLAGESLRLLFVIRVVENGGPGREMGVLTPKAQRFKGDFEKSLELQAQWAAGTIKRRFTGDLASFAERWCPTTGNLNADERRLNKHWLKNARYYMEERA